MFSLVSFIKSWLQRAPPASALAYHAYTRQFDVISTAEDLDAVLGQLTRREQAALDETWQLFEVSLQAWKTQVHLSALEASWRIRKDVSDEDRSNTIVLLLIDHSGSMRGQAILLAAATADVAQNFVAQLDCKVEVLGFTTTSWRGGKSRQHWRRRWRPAYPGRLCDLLHIIYKTADDSHASAGSHALKSMLRPHLHHENVDGEAIQWAATRLRARPGQRKILVVISDGAPVDDSTLSANDLGFLDRHIRQVIGEIEDARDIKLAAIGIGFDVGRYYSDHVVVKTSDELGLATMALLERLITTKWRHLELTFRP